MLCHALSSHLRRTFVAPSLHFYGCYCCPQFPITSPSLSPLVMAYHVVIDHVTGDYHLMVIAKERFEKLSLTAGTMTTLPRPCLYWV